MKISNKGEFQQIVINHSSNIDFKDFIKLYKNCSENHILVKMSKLNLWILLLEWRLKNRQNELRIKEENKFVLCKSYKQEQQETGTGNQLKTYLKLKKIKLDQNNARTN